MRMSEVTPMIIPMIAEVIDLGPSRLGTRIFSPSAANFDDFFQGE